MPEYENLEDILGTEMNSTHFGITHGTVQASIQLTTLMR